MSKISRTRGKNVELAIARYMGCKRNHFEAEDLQHPILSIEVKHRAAAPVLLRKAMAQAEAAAEQGKIATVVLHEQGQEYGRSYAVMRLKDLRDLVGGVK